MRSQLPPVVTAGEGSALQGAVTYTASSLADLRFGGLNGLTSVQLGAEATDLAGTVDIALEALLSGGLCALGNLGPLSGHPPDRPKPCRSP